MRAVVFGKGRVWLDRARPVPVPGPGEALIRVVLAGVCATDHALLRGYADFSGIPGHEWVGRVVSAPDDPAWVGRRVVGEITVACGHCASCRNRNPGHCLSRTVVGIRHRDGVFADWVVLPLANLHVVPAGIGDCQALFTEPLAAAVEIVQQTHVRPTDRVAVVGDGKLGLLVAQVLALTGCELTLIGRHPRPWLEARGLGVREESRLAAGWRADLVVECSGTPEGLTLARSLVRSRGRLVLKSTHLATTAMDLASLVVDEIVVLGSRCGPFSAALRLLERGSVAVEPMIEGVFSLDDAVGALTKSREKGTLKCVIQP
ncbi:MAG: alcohol dehydrogenase catalytic domain-containing protein [Magnetococcales bacterium]|nr:alcohol dehydrogenase catalytic domain-containing protein [Magnetococcales bacterium]